MPNQQLKDKFFATLKGSKFYRLLPAESQNDLVASFADVDDAKYEAALNTLIAAASDLTKIEQQKKANEEEQVVLAKEIQEGLRVLKKTGLIEADKRDREQSNSDADSLLKQIGKAGDSKKRKKFLGLF